TTGGEGLNATNTPVRYLITFAYDIRDLRLSGGPKWLKTDRFDITAKTARDHASSWPHRAELHERGSAEDIH
ncbi:MAG: TIGR03435 family protein, partial [Bryobacteraceae bacterium]